MFKSKKVELFTIFISIIYIFTSLYFLKVVNELSTNFDKYTNTYDLLIINEEKLNSDYDIYDKTFDIIILDSINQKLTERVNSLNELETVIHQLYSNLLVKSFPEYKTRVDITESWRRSLINVSKTNIDWGESVIAKDPESTINNKLLLANEANEKHETNIEIIENLRVNYGLSLNLFKVINNHLWSKIALFIIILLNLVLILFSFKLLLKYLKRKNLLNIFVYLILFIINILFPIYLFNTINQLLY